MPPEIIYGAFSACRMRFKLLPADYDHVLVYAPDAAGVKGRFPAVKGPPNLTVLRADPLLPRYGQATCMPQTYADLWNLPQWYARDFGNALLELVP